MRHYGLRPHTMTVTKHYQVYQRMNRSLKYLPGTGVSTLDSEEMKDLLVYKQPQEMIDYLQVTHRNWDEPEVSMRDLVDILTGIKTKLDNDHKRSGNGQRRSNGSNDGGESHAMESESESQSTDEDQHLMEDYY